MGPYARENEFACREPAWAPGCLRSLPAFTRCCLVSLTTPFASVLSSLPSTRPPPPPKALEMERAAAAAAREEARRAAELLTEREAKFKQARKTTGVLSCDGCDDYARVAGVAWLLGKQLSRSICSPRYTILHSPPYFPLYRAGSRRRRQRLHPRPARDAGAHAGAPGGAGGGSEDLQGGAASLSANPLTPHTRAFRGAGCTRKGR